MENTPLIQIAHSKIIGTLGPNGHISKTKAADKRGKEQS